MLSTNVAGLTITSIFWKMDQPELVKQIHLTQKSESKPGDFCELISTDFEDLKVHMSEEQIASSGIKIYKSYIKKLES